MKATLLAFLLTTGICGRAQGSGNPDGSVPTPAVSTGPATAPNLLWTPAALSEVAARAEVQNSFVLDRTTLGAMSAFLPQSDERLKPTIRKLDGISVHVYRFREDGLIDPEALDHLRREYEARGWKHLMSGHKSGEPERKTTDLWLVTDGIEVKGGSMLVVTPRTVSLVTFAGALNPIDLLHLRGHFGIPAASAGDFGDMK